MRTTDDQHVPYSRFATVNEAKIAAEAEAERLRREVAQLGQRAAQLEDRVAVAETRAAQASTRALNAERHAHRVQAETWITRVARAAGFVDLTDPCDNLDPDSIETPEQAKREVLALADKKPYLTQHPERRRARLSDFGIAVGAAVHEPEDDTAAVLAAVRDARKAPRDPLAPSEA